MDFVCAPAERKENIFDKLKNLVCPERGDSKDANMSTPFPLFNCFPSFTSQTCPVTATPVSCLNACPANNCSVKCPPPPAPPVQQVIVDVPTASPQPPQKVYVELPAPVQPHRQILLDVNSNSVPQCFGTCSPPCPNCAQFNNQQSKLFYENQPFSYHSCSPFWSPFCQSPSAWTCPLLMNYNNAPFEFCDLCEPTCAFKVMECCGGSAACKERELRCGILYTGCDCERRNGLQDQCPRTGCQGNPCCLAMPPACCPSRYANGRHLAGGRFSPVGGTGCCPPRCAPCFPCCPPPG